MARFVLSVALAVVCAIHCAKACDSEVTKKIKEWAVGADNPNYLDQLSGKYDFTSASLAKGSDSLTGKCLQATFANGKVDFVGFAEGSYDVEYDKGVLTFLDNGVAAWEAYVVYSTPSSITLYTCSFIDYESSSYAFTGVAVKEGANGLEDAKKGEELLAKLGVDNSVALTRCA